MARMTRSAVLACGLAVTGCAHWGQSQSYGPRQEVGRTLVGQPQLEEITSSSISAGFVAGGAYGGGGFGAVGGIAGTQDTVRRTHCVQQAQIDYVQPVTIAPRVEGRMRDVAGGLATGVTGLMVLAVAQARYAFQQSEYNSDLSLYQSDPSFFPMPEQPTAPTTAYMIGGAALAVGAGWLLYSVAALPHSPVPMTDVRERRWSEMAYVEVDGCER